MGGLLSRTTATVLYTGTCQYHQHSDDPSHLLSIESSIQMLGDDVVPFNSSKSRTSSSISVCARFGTPEDAVDASRNTSLTCGILRSISN
jgi:hypothetical protein